MADRFNYFLALRRIALRDVLAEPLEYHLRFIHRWYSTTFHVPLPEVPLLDQNHVLQAYYEDRYENMDEQAREEERKLLIESEADRIARTRAEDAEAFSNAEFQKEVEAMAAAEEAAEKQQQKAPITDTTPRSEGALPETNIPGPSIPRVLPGVKMRFVAEDEFAKLLEEDSSGVDMNPQTGNLPLKPPSDPR